MVVDCWKFDARFVGGGPGGGGGGGFGAFSGMLHSQQMLYSCPVNSMCQCTSKPNDTSTLIEINCNEVTLYKFPGKSLNDFFNHFRTIIEFNLYFILFSNWKTVVFLAF